MSLIVAHTSNSELLSRVMGGTGSGKTTFINLVSGSDLRVGMGLESCTNEVQLSRPFELNGRSVILIDTPGFDDTTKSDTDVLKVIAAHLVTSYEQGTKLAGVIYMHRISDFRMGGTSKRNFTMFRELCGESSLKSVLLVSNMWSEVKLELGEAREAELAGKDKFFKPVLEKGARMLRHDGTKEGAHRILRHLINQQPATLQIQDELVNKHLDIAHTGAGAELTRALQFQADRHSEELVNLRAEMEKALKAKDEETREELREEVEQKHQEIMRIRRDAEQMAAEYAEEKAKLDAKIFEMEDAHRKQVEALEALNEHVSTVQKQMEETKEEHARREQELKQVEEEDTRKARIAEEERARQEAENRRQEESRTRAKAIRDLAQARRDAEEKARAEIAQNSLPVPFVVVSSIISWLTRR
ncbi:P-loop containing nucleoside triphosphate hydrolase protein [Hygrophoropsis aurantiaca]|uniref:P-loop containing nucleoside triphosphate hydrolase protein n=1 Tax=Hygrophoropsis aurantiaca TaxID=72124 RepID=A0ACB8AIB6_9AGAM|nr:P-loop containing nucleoside triphosphate hydrolase protein [Hygrophoropsis aurantiaca]